MQMVDQYISDLTYILSKVRVSLVAQLVKNHLQCGRPGFDPWVGKIPPPGEGKGYPLQHSGLENSNGVAKSRTRLSDFHLHFSLSSKVKV